MDNQLFDRKYVLTISSPPVIDTAKKEVKPSVDYVLVEKKEDYRSIDQLESKVFTDLNIRCKIDSAKSKTKGQGAVIEVEGLSEDSLHFIRKNGIVVLEAGYSSTDTLPVILAGQISDKVVSEEGEINKLKIVVSDGYTPSSSVKISREYPPNTTYLEILEDLAGIYASNKIPLGRSIRDLRSLQGVGVDLPVDKLSLTYGHCLVGYLDTCLNQICKECGFTSYLSNSRLYIEPENYADNIQTYTFFSSNILSLQEITPANNNNSKDQQEQNNGYRLKCFLDGRIEVGMFINLNIEGESKGSFKVVSTSQDLNYEGQNWFTTMELQNV